jgi:prepilin-type N-terminal cleavage/methylation domain-containing protein
MCCVGNGVNRRRGFSLVEVMVVVGIIAILGAILIPVVSRVRGSGRLVQCVSNLRQFDAAFQEPGPNRPDTRLPQAEMWMSVVANSAPGAQKLLQCPDGAAASGMVVDGSSAQF